MEQIVFYPIPLDKLLCEIKAIITEALADNNQKLGEPLLNRQQVSEKFGISLVTLHRWTSLGLIQCNRVGGRIFYKLSDVEGALKTVKKYNHR